MAEQPDGQPGGEQDMCSRIDWDAVDCVELCADQYPDDADDFEACVRDNCPTVQSLILETLCMASLLCEPVNDMALHWDGANGSFKMSDECGELDGVVELSQDKPGAVEFDVFDAGELIGGFRSSGRPERCICPDDKSCPMRGCRELHSCSKYNDPSHETENCEL